MSDHQVGCCADNYKEGYERALKDIANLITGNYEECEHPDIVAFINKNGILTVAQMHEREYNRLAAIHRRETWFAEYLAAYEN